MHFVSQSQKKKDFLQILILRLQMNYDLSQVRRKADEFKVIPLASQR